MAESSNDMYLNLLMAIYYLAASAAIIAGGIWAYYKYKEYRELKQRIQFDIDARIYKLKTPIMMNSYSKYLNIKGKKEEHQGAKKHTHVLEILFKFANKGNIDFRLYNLQVKIKTLPDEVEVDEEEGHLKLFTIFKSGNIVRKDIGYWYIEPHIEQTISYLALIVEPKDLIQIIGEFCLDGERILPILPQKEIKSKLGLKAHTAQKTFQLDSYGFPKESIQQPRIMDS